METSGTTWRLRSRWWGRIITITITSLITSTTMCNHSVLAWAAPDEWGELENSNCSLTWINYMKLSNFLNSNCFNIKLNWSNCRDKIDIDISHDWLIEKKKNTENTMFVFSTDFLVKGFEYCLCRLSQAVSCFIKLYVFGLSEPTFYDKLSKMMEENMGGDMRG